MSLKNPNKSSPNYIHGIAAGLLLILFLQLITSVSLKSPTMDEELYLARGIAPLKTGDFRLNFMHPPLISVLSSIPLLFIKDLRLPLDTPHWEACKYQASYPDFVYFADKFLWEYNKNADQLIFLGRIPIMLLSVLLGFLVFTWARQLYGVKSGLFALFLYVFSPNILAHSRLITSDLGVSCFVFLAVFCFWRFCHNPGRKNLILTGIVLGLSLLAKSSALSLGPLFTIMGLVYVFFNREFNPRFAIPFKKRFSSSLQPFYAIIISVLVMMFMSGIVLWGGYGFKLERHYFPDHRPHADLDNLVNDYIAPRFPQRAQAIRQWLYHFMENTPLPLITYLRGVIKFARLQGWGHFANFLMGEHRPQGWWYYFFLAYLIKVPLPGIILLLFLIAYDLGLKRLSWVRNKLCLTFAPTGEKAAGVDTFFVVAFPLALFWASTKTSFNYGLKYVLPAFPFIFVYISRIVNLKASRQHILNGLLAVLGLWYIYAAASIYPHYLAYFNELVGGPDNGYKYMVDANLDWGQDLPGLAAYMKQNNIDRIKLAYYGLAKPGYYGIDYERLDCKPTTGLLAVSATKLQGLYAINDKGELTTKLDCYDWLKQHKPIHKIGYSIFIYDIK
jgi:4-amino-4-deoxy-L-arabinose transferase-like glycosyltransferase